VNAIMLLGAFLVLSCRGLVIGWGTDRAGALARRERWLHDAARCVDL
jgi:hypothetical protein